MPKEIRKILCPIDFSALSRPLISFSMGLAERFKAELLLCHVIFGNPNLMDGSPQCRTQASKETAIRRTQRKINKLTEFKFSQQQLKILFGEPVEEILKLATTEGIHIVVMASYGLSGIQRFLAGALVEQLARTLPCPCLILQGGKQRRGASPDARPEIRQILVGYDADGGFRDRIEYGRQFAEAFQAELTVLQAVDRPGPDPGRKLDIAPYELAQQSHLDQTRQRLTEELKQMGMPDSSIGVHVRPGHPGEELIRSASPASLIIVGVKPRSFFSRLLIGSTTEMVIRHAACPALIVPNNAT